MNNPRNRCVNPLGLKAHIKYNVRKVPATVVSKVPTLNNQKICDSCRKKLCAMSDVELRFLHTRSVDFLEESPVNIPVPEESVSDPRDVADTIQNNDNQFSNTVAVVPEKCELEDPYKVEDYDISNINALQRLSIEVPNNPAEPLSQDSVHSTLYSSQSTFTSGSTTISQSSNPSDCSYHPSPVKRLRVAPKVDNDDDNLDLLAAGREILDQLREKFSRPDTSRSEKIVILTLVPKSWSVRQTAGFFSTTRSMAEIAKNLVNDQGILTSPNRKRGKKLPQSTVDTVVAFYVNDNNSREMPGKKDFISVKQLDGSRQQVQKRLIYCNLNEMYELFKEKYPELDIGFSTFAKLRPDHCIFAGASGTHTVCVCVHHENVKLMIEASNLSALTANTAHPLTKYQDFINLTLCGNPTSDCHLGECDKCPGTGCLESHIQSVFDDNDIERIEFHNWTETDRATMNVNILNSEAFVKSLCEKIDKLKTHAFIAQQQSEYLDYRKEHLGSNEFIIQCDFAENYAFVKQNAIQSFHWNNDQCTIHTVVYYYKENDELCHGSMVILSDDLQHNTVAVHSSQMKIMQHLKEKFTPEKVIYFTDGAAQHYKNRFNFVNMSQHEADFGVPAEWHFFGTAHGKGPCDGIGGNVKRLAARASLQAVNPENQILNPQALYNWARKTLVKTQVAFSSKTEHAAVAESLLARFKGAKTIPGTQKLHCIIPNREGQLILKKFSAADKFETFPKSSGKKRSR